MKLVNAGVHTGDSTSTFPAVTISNNAITAVKMVNAGVFTGDATSTFPAITIGALAITNSKVANTTLTLGSKVADTPAINTVFAGASSGGAAVPTYRALVDADMPTRLAGGGTQAFKAHGMIYSNATPGGTAADTTEDTMQTYTLPASSFNVNGQCIRIHATGTCVSTANALTLRVYFGSTVIHTITLTASLAGLWVVDATAWRVASNSQWCDSASQKSLTASSYTPEMNSITNAQTDTSTIVIKITGQEATTGTLNSITCKSISIWFSNE